MIQLDCWLPEKEMFGVFSVRTVTLENGALCVTCANEVFQFAITFKEGVKAYLVRETAQIKGRFDELAPEYKILMRGNTFFKLKGDSLFEELKEEADTHFVVWAANYAVDILANKNPAVKLDMAPGRRPGGAV